MGQQQVLAICGVKNSGKTTLITRLLPLLMEKGIKTAVIKHDGHEFEADVPGTDTYRHLHAGACGTAVFSASRYMLVKNQPGISEKELEKFFPEADLILLEGFKNSIYPKLEVVRKHNSEKSISNREGLLAIVTDFSKKECLEKFAELGEKLAFLPLNHPEEIRDFLIENLGLFPFSTGHDRGV